MNVSVQQVRLTRLAHGGGCGCKLAPAVLQELLAGQAVAAPFRELLVGTETGDDAAVWQLDEDTCVLATTDFFMPIVDDPYDFGRIAATNAICRHLCDGRPADHGASHPRYARRQDFDRYRARDSSWRRGDLRRRRHSRRWRPFDRFAEPIYGLAVIGTCRPARMCGAIPTRVPGDAVILTKALGVGVYSAALKKGELSTTRPMRK